MLSKARLDLYGEIGECIGNTPTVVYRGNVPNGNEITIKRECDNLFGSHYDRVFVALFRHYEGVGAIQPGDKVIETTSGAAGVSFAGIGKRLGYECFVALPAGGEIAREEAIKAQLDSSDHLILTPECDYISGFPEFLAKFLPQHRDYFFLNHSMGKRGSNNELTLTAMESIATELIENGNLDCFIPAVGNGSSVLGPGRKIKQLSNGLNVIAFETFQSAVAYELMNPGEYEKVYGIRPGSMSRHRLPGTSYPGISFPHIINAVNDSIIDEVMLVSDQMTDGEYHKLTGRKDTESLPHWDSEICDNGDLGRTGRAGIAVALRLAEKIEDKKMAVIAYDKADRYDD